MPGVYFPISLVRWLFHFYSCEKGGDLVVPDEGNVTFSCSPPQLVSCTFLSSSSSFLSLPSAAAAGAGGFSVRFQFRTWNADGLLLSLQLNPEPQRLELRISNSRLSLTLQNSGRQKSEVSVGHRVNDGLWHAVSLDSRDLQIALTLDAESPSTVELWQQLESRGNVYFGGCPDKDCQRQTPTFQGCLRLVFINGKPVNLSSVQQGLLGNFNELKFDTCNIRDSPSSCGPREQDGQTCDRTEAPRMAPEHRNKTNMLAAAFYFVLGPWSLAGSGYADGQVMSCHGDLARLKERRHSNVPL
ncbi:Contactin-associated protein-like 4 [Takifugu flavidus]|uniref:Contactin-associated protein-like 4 n=1 Tax=Takifugu flavidus TaxID=433684 RepID=A0A5C6PM10_9TELE|nr:Contactin-associated protein-like 4 [Takifugu flavidus]